MVPHAKGNSNVNKLSGTDLIHGDDGLHGPEVAPSISVSTSTFGAVCARYGELTVRDTAAFRLPSPMEEPPAKKEFDVWKPTRHIYSRYTQGVTTRVEHVLSKITVGDLTFYSAIEDVYIC